MALFDHRVFRRNDEWWAAQVHSASGAGYGSGNVPMTSERVYFSSLTDRDRNTLTARILPGSLNRLSHESLLLVLGAGEDFGSHFRMAAYNAPSLEELGPAIHTDEENLRWAVRASRAVRLDEGGRPLQSSGLEFICLDDSALRKEVLVEGGHTVNVQQLDLAAIVRDIKATFQD
jgi:hypothetical protein